jgi:hypothetical protein
MAEEPKQQDRDAQGTEQQDFSWRGFKEFFQANPTVVFTLLYLYVTAIGLLYSWVLYGKFGINIFDYSEIGDFLLAAFKNPIALVSAGVLAVMGAAWLSYRASRLEDQVKWDEQLMESYSFATVLIVISIAFAIVFGSLILPYLSASRSASSIKDGETREVDVRYRSFKGSAGQVTEPDLGLIEATQKTVFFYVCRQQAYACDSASADSLDRGSRRRVTSCTRCNLPRIRLLRRW